MKQLTFSSMAAARLRANKRQYLSLILGIFLSVFLVGTMVLTVYGIYTAYLHRRYDKVGYLDAVALESQYSAINSEVLEEMGFFDQIGQVYLSGAVTDTNLYLGYYDSVGQELLNLKSVAGRLPEHPGEIAMEQSAQEILEVSLEIGDTLELSITPVAGTPENRTFTLVGILPERSAHFEEPNFDGICEFPAIVTSDREPAFTVGRLHTNHVMTLLPEVSMDTMLDYAWDTGYALKLYGLSATGEREYNSDRSTVMRYLDEEGLTRENMVRLWRLFTGQNKMGADADMFNAISIALILAAALLLSCGVGICGAMEGILTKRREEIGVLRAVGATRRQIRRMFGRENLLLALVTAPLSLGASCLTVWILSRLMPQSIRFSFELWLLAPIGVFAVVVILVSGYLPLVRASKQMPVRAIRDTAMLRRSKGIRGKGEFSPTRLIAARRVRFNPTRQVGAALLVGLMLVCTGQLTGLMTDYWKNNSKPSYAFEIWGDGRTCTTSYSTVYESPSLSRESIRQIRNLDHVKSLTLRRNMCITMVLDEVPLYATREGWWDDFKFGMLDEAQFQEALSKKPEQVQGLRNSHATLRWEYLNFLEAYEIPGEAYSTELVTMELNRENLEKLNSRLESGKINVDAINEGREVIVIAPELWYAPGNNRPYQHWNSQEAAQEALGSGKAELVAWNNVVTAGQELPLLHIYQTKQYSPYYREDVTVTVGAVSSFVEENTDMGPDNYMYLITTEQGLENLGLRVEELDEMEIYLDGDISREAEAALEERLTAISRRAPGYTVRNCMAGFRTQQAERNRVLTLILSVMLLFFSVAVGMVVSAVTRQMHSEGRVIGMLRAVGADEKTILGCYSGPITVSTVAGAGIGLAVILGYLGNHLYWAMQGMPMRATFALWQILLMTLTVCLMAAACWLACRFFLRLRIREIVKMSIIENIREL